MLGKKLLELRKERGLTQAELARLLGVAQQSVAQWEKGKNLPGNVSRTKICDFFGVSASFLYADDDKNVEKKKNKKPGVNIPVLGYVAAGVPIEAITDIEDYEEIDADLAEKGKYFAWRVKGYSMSPRIMPGDIAIVKVQENCSDGDLCIVQIGGSEAAMKQVYKKANGIVLIALNPMVFPPHFFTADEVQNLPVQIIGVVAEVRIRNLKGTVL